MMRRVLLATTAAFALMGSAHAQDMDHGSHAGHDMGGMMHDMPMAKPAPKPPAKPKPKPAAKPAPATKAKAARAHAGPAAAHTPTRSVRTPAASTPPAAPPFSASHGDHGRTASPPATGMATDHGGMDHGTMDHSTMDHGAVDHGAMGHGVMDQPMIDDAPGASPGAHTEHAMDGDHVMTDHGAMNHGTGGTALPAGDAPPPPQPTTWAADGAHDPADMARVRAALWKEHGGATLSQLMFNLAEYRMHKGRDGFRWDGEAWMGGDIHRVVIRTEGEATAGKGVDSAEIQALYSRAIGSYFNLQAGVRQDITPNPSRTYASIGVEGLAPYWFDVEATLFLSNKGDMLGRVEGYYDQRITQRLILQPRAELNLAAQDVPESGIGAGLSDAELGLRLRYEIAREFAPYIGISHDWKFGDTARFTRALGEERSSTSFVTGIRFWF
jgi:copper resistance protein B